MNKAGNLISPHGGRLINRVLTKKKAAGLLKDNSVRRLALDRDTLLDLENIALGVYSPLEGFMTEAEFKGAAFKGRLPGGLPWTIPIMLPIRKQDSKKTGRGSRILLCDEYDTVIGTIKIKDIYTVDLNKASRHIFGTNSRRHPGVRKFHQTGGTFIGGKIDLIQPNKYRFHDFNLKPAHVRNLIRQRGWKSVAGFQTRNIPHRAHEFLQKAALTGVDGIFIHPIIGWKKDGDFNPKMIIESYRILIKHYYPKGRSIFSGLATAMRYAGPREAIFHSIIRKNFGCTHFIVGRDHAGVGGFYDLYAAHRIFDKFPDVGITPVLLRGPYYCKKCSGIVNDKICPHTGTKHVVEISGTTIRNTLARDKKVPGEYLRREISDFIYKHRKKCFI